jgi:hypothetical protein
MTKGESSVQIRFISLIPNLMGGEGHIIPYHQAVGQAVRQLGWKHHILAPSDAQIPDFPPAGSPLLPIIELELDGNLWQKLGRLKDAIAFAQVLAQQLNALITSSDSPKVIFLERFIHLQLLALAIALYQVPTRMLSVWLLYRRDTHLDKTRWIYKFLNQLIVWRLGDRQLQLLTDSELLAQSLAQYFAQPVSVMPIPHTDVLDFNVLGSNTLNSGVFDSDVLNSEDKIPQPFPQLLCWWPGAPREEKGWHRLKALVATAHPRADQICLLAAESANLTAIANGIHSKSIPDHLSRKDYNYWLSLCNIVLLPYDSEAYRERTSGIFTECIIAGKMPLVTPHTWMARELAQYQLQDLVIDWEAGEQVIDKILELSHDQPIGDKLKAMQSVYLRRHNVGSFAEQLGKLYDRNHPR